VAILLNLVKYTTHWSYDAKGFYDKNKQNYFIILVDYRGL